MQNVIGGRKQLSLRGHKHALLASAVAMMWAGSAFGQTTTLYYNKSGGTLWDLVTKDWATTLGGTDKNLWTQGDIADLDGGTISVASGIDVQVGGIIFDSTSSGSATAPNITVSGATGPWELDFGSNNFNITQNTTAKQFIAAPIVGTGNMTINLTKAATAADGSAIVLAGNMSGFTGEITLNNAFTAPAGGYTAANSATLHIDTGLSGGTINLDEFTSLYNSSQVTGAGTAGDPWTNSTGKSPNYYTVSNNIELNYNAANENGATNVTNNIGGSNGPTGTSKVEVFSGVISSPMGTTKDGLNIVSNLDIGGASNRGTIVLANQETYNGSTIVGVLNTNGMVQFAAENALPSNTALIIGTGTTAIGPTDLDGYDETVASLSTGTTSPTAANVGNIYNLSVNSSALSFQQNVNNNGVQNPSNQFVTLTISPNATTNTVFNGDIGDSSTSVNPLNNNAPYTGNTTANRNIALVVNGPSGGGTHTLTLAPLGSSGNEYNGATTVNANATLVLGRVTTGTPGSAYTITGTGNITVGNGASLASAATVSGTYAGGAAGMIILQKGSSFLPGEAAVSSGSAALSPNNTGTLSTSNIEWDSGATMTFGLEGTSSFDSVNLVNSDTSVGTLTLANPTNDASPNYTINIDGGFLVPGTYPLVTGNISGDQTNADHTSQLIKLNTSGIGPGQYKLLDLGNALDLQVSGTALVLQWDPSGGGLAGGYDGDVLEEGGTWADGSSFVNLNNGSEVTWNNSGYTAYDVLIGNDRMQAGGTITLGENITIGGALRIGPIYPGTVGNDYYYTITDGGSGHTLTLMNGVIVNTAGSTSQGAPSAVIAAPIMLGASQNWEIDPTEYLDVEGSINGAGYTLTLIGAANSTSGGTLFLNAPGSFAGLTVDGGYVLLGNAGAIGNAAITLNGGGLQYAVSTTVTNTITVGSNGGSLGATQQSGGGAAYNVTFTQPISGGTNSLNLVGAGNLTFSSGITAGALTVNTSNTAGYGTVALNANNSLGALNISAGSVTIASGTTNTLGAINVASGTLMLNGTNTISSLTISGGTVTANSPAALDNVNNPAINLGPVTGSTGGTLIIPGFSTLANNINIGTNGSASEYLQDTVPLALSGNISGSGNIHLIGPDFTISGTNTNTNSTDFDTEGMTVHATSTTAFGTSTLLANADATVDVETNVSANDIRGIKTTATTPTTLTKTGPGTLTLTGTASTATLAGSAVVINQGELVMEQYQELMSNVSGAAALNITANAGTTLAADFNSSSTRTGGAVTLNGATLIHDATSTGDSYFAAGSASDVWTITGNSKIDEATNGVTNNVVLRLTNPVVVTSGAVLTLESDDTTDNVANDSLVFSGPANLTDTGTTTTPDTYNTFAIQSGATVVESGPGNVRFGQTTSQGIAIIGQGSSNASLPNNGESVMRLGGNFYMTDKAATNNIVTSLVVAGSGSQGLRIEAPMNATYSSASTGTTGLFGLDSFNTTTGNVYTVYSPNRAMALSSPYNYLDINNTITKSITPSGTLTLAATDAGGATGVVSGGPSNPCAVSLALTNGSGSGGTLAYQLDPSPGNGSLANFAGVTIEQQSSVSSAQVTAQLLGTTLLSSLTISGGAKMDLQSNALVIDSAAAPPTATIAGYLTSAYDNGNWDGPGIGSTHVGLLAGTSIGYVENDRLPLFSQPEYTNFDGQTVDANADLVKYTWMGDLNLDGVVDSTDLAMMGALGNGNVGWMGGDLNYDGKVNSDDWSLLMLGDAVQSGQLTSAIPEPSFGMSLLFLAPALIRRNRRSNPVG
ncbi:MAG TPA: hypothetical protein VGG19_06480 [Tepidisphaeraceae bacterium]|jgi:hypothetical protein